MRQTSRNFVAESGEESIGAPDLPAEQRAYEFPQIWDKAWFPDEDYERVRNVSDFIPRNTRTLLDVGCGNGLFLNYVKQHHPHPFSALVGVDRSEAALEHVQTDKLLANVDKLPFANEGFDTVTCMEVLEHLPLTTYSRAVSEIARVAKGCIIVSVPYRQDLKNSLCECPSCQTRFNPDFHVRSFDEDTLRSLFLAHSFTLTEIKYLGEQVVRYDRDYRMRVRQLFHPSCPEYPSYAICPVCGFFDEERLSRDLVHRKRARHVLQHPVVETPSRSRVRAFIASVLPTRSTYRWIAGIYTRV